MSHNRIARMLGLDRIRYAIWPRGDCWEWRSGKSSAGYGEIYDTDAKKHLYVHRVSYEMAKGPIPAGLEIDHICGHPWCVRPTHLEAVTHAENLRRGWLRRGAWCPHHKRKWSCPKCENAVRLAKARAAGRGDKGAKNRNKTHCKRGHEFTPDNIYRWDKRPSGRICKECRRLRKSLKKRAA